MALVTAHQYAAMAATLPPGCLAVKSPVSPGASPVGEVSAAAAIMLGQARCRQTKRARGKSVAKDAAAAGAVLTSHQRLPPAAARTHVIMALASDRTDAVPIASKPSPSFRQVVIACAHSGRIPVPDVHAHPGLLSRIEVR